MITQHKEFPELSPEASAACRAASVAWGTHTFLMYPADRRGLAAFLLEVIKQATDRNGILLVSGLQAIAANIHSPPPPPPTLAQAQEADLTTSQGRAMVSAFLANLAAETQP